MWSRVSLLCLIAVAGCKSGDGVAVVRSGAEYQDTIAKAQQLSEEPLKAFDAGETLLPKQEDDLREAARLFKSMIGFTPSNMGSHTGLGKIWHALGDLPEAKKELTLAINFAPATTDEAINLTLADAHASLSRVYFDMKQYKPAMDHGRVARSLAPKNPDYAVYQASAAIQLGFDDEAHKLIHEALDLDPYHERAQALDRFINRVHTKEASPSSPPSGAGKP